MYDQFKDLIREAEENFTVQLTNPMLYDRLNILSAEYSVSVEYLVNEAVNRMIFCQVNAENRISHSKDCLFQSGRMPIMGIFYNRKIREAHRYLTEPGCAFGFSGLTASRWNASRWQSMFCVLSFPISTKIPFRKTVLYTLLTFILGVVFIAVMKKIPILKRLI